MTDMDVVWTTVLGVCLLVAVYPYVGYPVLLKCLSWLRSSPLPATALTEWPTISITVPVYNEEATIRATLESILAIDYPPEKRQILVISDASTDRTNEIVREFAADGVELICLGQRGGKTAAENAGVKHIRGEILVNTDASVRIDPSALKPLVSALADPTVGVASGRDISVAKIGDTSTIDDVNRAESGYVGYEMSVRALETRVDGIVGASGCFYATRRKLHTEIVPEALSRDFAAPLIAREHDLRSVSVPEAICYVPRTASLRREYRRKVRTMARGLDTLLYKRHLLNPFRYGLFAWMLFSHKLARWLLPWALLVGVVTVGFIAGHHVWARWVLGASAVWGLIAAAGWFWPARRLPRAVAVPTYIMAGIVAGVHAWITFFRGDRSPIWEPTRRELPAAGSVAGTHR